MSFTKQPKSYPNFSDVPLLSPVVVTEAVFDQVTFDTIAFETVTVSSIYLKQDKSSPNYTKQSL